MLFLFKMTLTSAFRYEIVPLLTNRRKEEGKRKKQHTLLTTEYLTNTIS